MKRVTDEDLDEMVDMCGGVVALDGESRLGYAIRAELLALRKVADAAVRYCGSPDGYRALKAALREAGL